MLSTMVTYISPSSVVFDVPWSSITRFTSHMLYNVRIKSGRGYLPGICQGNGVGSGCRTATQDPWRSSGSREARSISSPATLVASLFRLPLAGREESVAFSDPRSESSPPGAESAPGRNCRKVQVHGTCHSFRTEPPFQLVKPMLGCVALSVFDRNVFLIAMT